MPSSFSGGATGPSGTRIDKAAIATTDLIAAQAGKAIRVYGMRMNVAGAVIVTILDGATILERFNFAGNGGGLFLDLRDVPYYVTTPGNALRITLSAAVQVDGMVDASVY